MTTAEISALVQGYYHAWTQRDFDTVRAHLADGLDFRSEQDRFWSADDFLENCWSYSEGLQGVLCVKEVCDGDQVFVILDWHMESGDRFASAEYLRIEEGRIAEILVVNNRPHLGAMLDLPEAE